MPQKAYKRRPPRLRGRSKPHPRIPLGGSAVYPEQRPVLDPLMVRMAPRMPDPPRGARIGRANVGGEVEQLAHALGADQVHVFFYDKNYRAWLWIEWGQP